MAQRRKTRLRRRVPAAPAAWRRGKHLVDCDPARLDRKLIRRFLARSYWANGIPPGIVDRSMRGSLCFGLYEGGRQIGFARVISDFATYAYLCDVFIVGSRRGRGLGAWLMDCILAHPRLQGLRRWALVTRDAQEFYRRLGFRSPARRNEYMEIVRRDIYRKRPQH